MKTVYGNFQNFSFRYDPETFRFQCFYHGFDADREQLFMDGRIIHGSGEEIPPRPEPYYELLPTSGERLPMFREGRKYTFLYRGEDTKYHFDIFFEMHKGELQIRFFGNLVFLGTLHWSEDVSDTFACRYEAAGAALQGASGPVTRKGDDMLFDRKRDRALRFSVRGNFELGYDWDKACYTFRYSHKNEVPVNMLRIRGIENFVARSMNMRYTPIDKSRWFSTPPVGWMTWYATRFDACEKEVLENTKKMKELLGAYTDKLVSWVDWEWYHKNIKGDGEGGGNVFSPCADTYPHGLAPVAKKIRRMGCIPAIWVGLSCEGNKNRWFEAHPDCVFGPVPRWCGQWWIDPTRPAIYDEYIPMVMKQLLSWGYEAVKWDCLTITGYVWEEFRDRIGSPRVSTEQFQKKIVSCGRRALGDDIYLLLCNPVSDSDISTGSEVCDAARIGGDIFKWDEFVHQAVDTLHHFYPIHNTILYADCDNLVIRPEYNTAAQARSRVSFYGLSGVPLTIGDRFREYDAERIDMLRRIVPVVDMHPVELSSRTPDGSERRFLAAFSRPFGTWSVLALTNLDEKNPAGMAVDFAGECRLETGNGRRYAVYDFWRKKFLGLFEDGLTVDVPPCDTAVLRITPVEDDGLPTLVSSSRHITQGGHELVSMKRTKDRVTGEVLCVGGEPCRLTFYVPDGVKLRVRGGGWRQKGNCGELTVVGAESGSVSWSLESR